jgi:hypothetical protein
LSAGSHSANNRQKPYEKHDECVADAEGATEYAIRYGGRDFIVTAHSRYDAEEAAEYYRPETTDESQPDLIK